MGSQTGLEVTLTIPPEVYAQVQQVAAKEDRNLDEFLQALIVEGLDNHLSTRQIFEAISRSYQGRLQQEGKLGQSREEVLRDLQELREQVADELYPN